MLNWNEKNKELLYSCLIFSLCYIFLILLALRPPFSFDSYWHLQMGKDLLENGLSPWVDHYSFTYPGKGISSVPVLFQTMLASFVYFLGDSNGFYFFKLFYVTLIMFFIFVYIRQIKASWFIVLLVLPFIAYFIHLRLIVRPEILSNVLSVICLSLYLRARTSFATKELVYICLLLLFWVNYHSPIFGYVIVFGLFLDKAIQKITDGDDDFSWMQWFVWGGIIFLIGFIKPGGQHFLITTLKLLTEDFGAYTHEYIPSYQFYSTNKLVFLLWMLSLYTAIWSLIKKQYGYAFIVIFLVYFSWSTTRVITSVAIINLCIFAFLLCQISYSRLLSTLRPLIRNSLFFAAICLSTLIFYAIVKDILISIESHEDEFQTVSKRYPLQVVDYLKHHQSGGNILNLMEIGGYLVYKLSPEFKVYVDGRTNILYPIEFVRDNFNMVNNKTMLKNEVESYDIQYAIYKNTPARLLSFSDIDNLMLNFADDNFLVFSEKKEVTFPVVSKLIVFPMCWSERLVSSVQGEIFLSEELFSDAVYTVKYNLEFLSKYISHENKQKFFSGIYSDDLFSDSGMRLAGYLALKSHSYEAASRLFSSIEIKNGYDYLMFAYAMAEARHYNEAEEILLYFNYLNESVKKRKELSYEQAAIFVQVMRVIQKNSTLKKIPSSYADILEENLKKTKYKNGLPLTLVLPYQDLCNKVF